jgi:serine protease AprX
MRQFLRLWLFSILLLPLAVSAADLSPQLQDALAAAHWNEPIPIIVTFASQPDLRPLKVHPKKIRRQGVVKHLHVNAEQSQKEVRNFLRGRGRGFEALWIVNALALEATPQMIETLADRPEIAAIELDVLIEAPETVPAPASASPWNISAVGAPDLWAFGARGQGVTVAIVDTGVNLNHADLHSSWRGGSNSWYDPYGNTPEPYDVEGHGTAVAGIIVGGRSDGSTSGVAPQANWIAAKAFPDEGIAKISHIILSLQWLLDPNRDQSGRDAPDLVNLSWGFDAPNKCLNGNSDSSSVPGSIRQALQTLRAAGIGIVAAAGNKGGDGASSISPGNYPEIFAVGAVDRLSQIAPFSSRGPSACDQTIYPDLVAPGVAIRSLTGQTWSGTSVAAPHVTGVMALILSAFPDMEVGGLEELLRASGTDLGQEGPDYDYGFGMVNAAAALDLLNRPPFPAQLLSPENESIQGNTVTFRWSTPSDPFGLTVANLLLVSGTEDFSILLVEAEAQADTLLAGAGNLLIAWGVAVLVRRNRRGAATLLVSLALLTMAACGSGDGGSLSTGVDEGSAQSVSGLRPGTYFWKVVSENPLGKKSESDVWLFTIK